MRTINFILDLCYNPIRLEQTEINSSTKTALQLKLAKYELIQFLACYFIATLCLIGGVALVVLGATGAITLFLGVAGWKAKLINLSPGAFLFLTGVAIAWFGRYQFRHTT